MKPFILSLVITFLPVQSIASTFKILAPDNGSGFSSNGQHRLFGIIGGSISLGISTNGTIENHNPYFPTTVHGVTPPPVTPPPLPVENIKVIAYPNPLRPHMGDRGVQFLNLEAGATIKILNIVGEAIRILYTDSSGKVFWDGTNDDGRLVASGIYLCFITEGRKTRVMKIGVEQ